MENSTTSKIIIGSFLGLLALCLVWAITAQQSKLSLTKRLNETESNSKALLSEKLQIQKQLDKSNDSTKVLTNETKELSELLEHRTNVLTTQTQENQKIKRALRFAEQKYNEESELNKGLRAKLDSQNISYSSLNQNLLDSINSLKDQNAYLSDELDNAIMRSIDQTLISGLKRNNSKVTSKARATKKLVASVEVPGNLKDLRFIVEGPDGNVVSNSDSQLTARVLANDQLTVASSNNTISPEVKSQNIEISYVPDQRLKPGLYTFKIFNDDKYVGSMMVTLR